jgi:hypothetical protein
VLIIGKAARFSCSKEIARYLGLVPKEDSRLMMFELWHAKNNLGAGKQSLEH